MTDFEGLLAALARGGVEFILIGGVAARAHGSARLTQDLDVVYSRDPANVDRLVEALAPHAPYLRGAPPGLPFRFDATTVRRPGAREGAANLRAGASAGNGDSSACPVAR